MNKIDFSFRERSLWHVLVGDNSYRFWPTKIGLIWMDVKDCKTKTGLSHTFKHVNNSTFLVSTEPFPVEP
jgi:hypothetical protein